MEKSRKIVFFDIDHTIFNTRLYQSLCYLTIAQKEGITDSQEFIAICHEAYQELRSNVRGTFTLSAFIDKLAEKFSLSLDKKEIEKIFAQEDIIEQAVYQDVEKVLQDFSSRENVRLGIFSAGMVSLQKAKISSLVHLFQEEHIHINEVDKIQDIPSIIEKHQSDQIYVVDDLANVLYSLKSQDQNIITILIERQGGVKYESIERFKPDYRITSFPELTSIIT